MNYSPEIKHMPFIQTLTSIIVVAIENKRFASELLEQEVQQKELPVAGEMQKLLFPLEFPKTKYIEVAARYEPKHLVGGDYYDFFPQEDGSMYVVCGDATGHGLNAGMMVSITKAGLYLSLIHI